MNMWRDHGSAARNMDLYHQYMERKLYYTSTEVRVDDGTISVFCPRPAPILFQVLEGGKRFLVETHNIDVRALATAQKIIDTCRATDWELAGAVLDAVDDARKRSLKLHQCLGKGYININACRQAVAADPYQVRLHELAEEFGDIHSLALKLMWQHVDPLYCLLREDRNIFHDSATVVKIEEALEIFQQWRARVGHFLNRRYEIIRFSDFLLMWKPDWADLNRV